MAFDGFPLRPSRVTAWVVARLAHVSPEEITRQHLLLTDGSAMRSVMTGLVYAIAALLIPLPWVLACAALDFGSEKLGARWMERLVPAINPLRYFGTVLAGIASQAGFATALALCYQSDIPLAQPFAAGVITLTMLQMASIRVIHQPYAVTGLATTFAVSMAAVIYDWESRSGAAGLAVSLIALCAAGYFIAAIVQTNHALHAGIARERASARAADQAKSRFLAQMSHELRTPLNAILGLGHAELAQARDPASVERLQLVTDAAKGLAVILDDILDMSAIEAGHLPIRPVPCDPAQEITTTTALYRPLYQAQGLSVTLILSPDLPRRAALDSQRLRQCLSNLFSNALKHTRQGGATLAAQLGPDGRLAITFSDTGPGIPEAEADRLFQPFQRGKSDQAGTGLGLSITRALARSMGGDLRLEPSTQGARFLLTLGWRPAPPAVALSPARQEIEWSAKAKSQLKSHAGLRVLVVDDIATNRLVAKAHLALHGVTAVEAGSGAEALGLLQHSPVDLVLLDMNMPDMDGTQTLHGIRALAGYATLPVIAMTADATEAHRRKYLAAGMDGYLAKPLTPEAVAHMLDQFTPHKAKMPAESAPTSLDPAP